MPRAIWSGAISFGLVSIPIKLFSAVKPKEVRFHLVHDEDGARIREKRVCSVEDKEVPYEHVAKGYEVSRGRYVVISREELAALDPEATRTIEIEDFVDLDEIDPIYYEHSYYLAPDRGGDKAYQLLLAALKKMNKVAIARMVLRTKQYLCALRPTGAALSLSTMLWADEVVPAADLAGLPPASARVRADELSMAQQLIESRATEFRAEKYRDDYRERVLALLKQKAEGREIVTPGPARAAKVIDLMDALKASLHSAKPKPARRRRARRRATKRSA
jgi:DNA end-binding protein Ku